MPKKINITTLYAIKSKKYIHFLGATCRGLSIYWHHFLTKISFGFKINKALCVRRRHTDVIKETTQISLVSMSLEG